MDALLLVHISNCWKQLHNNTSAALKHAQTDVEKQGLSADLNFIHQQLDAVNERLRAVTPIDSYGASVLYAEVRR